MKKITQKDYQQEDFQALENVTLSNIDLSKFSSEERVLLYTFAIYCEALTKKDMDTIGNMISADFVFTHHSGRRQNVNEYFHDVSDGAILYHNIRIEEPKFEMKEATATLTVTATFDLTAYGEKDSYTSTRTHYYENWDGDWVEVNDPSEVEE